MNKVILVGRLTKEPEVRYTNNGKAVANLTLAVDTVFGKKKRTDFLTIIVWGNSAEFCGNNLNKGSKVLIEGRLQVRSYDAKDGSKRYVTEIVSGYLESLERKKESKAKTVVADPNDIPSSFGTEVTDKDVPF